MVAGLSSTRPERVMAWMLEQDPVEVTFDAGASVSSAIPIDGKACQNMAIEFPAAWTDANLGFRASTDGVTYMPIRTETGGRVRVSGIVTDEVSIYETPHDELRALMRYNYVQLESLSIADNATPVVQTLARTLKVSILP